MEHHVRPMCAWMGLSPEGEAARACDRPATGYVVARDGHHVYTCEEHIAHAKQVAGSGQYVHGVPPSGGGPPTAQHGAVRQGRHNASVVGTME